MTSRVRCSMHKDCFANVDGKCICLTDNNFKNNKCSFYKRKTQLAAEQRQIKKRLIGMNRTDLAEGYSGRVSYV